MPRVVEGSEATAGASSEDELVDPNLFGKPSEEAWQERLKPSLF
jgi:hypothetical protein